MSGLAAGAGCIFWLQNREVTILGSPADYGKKLKVFEKRKGEIFLICFVIIVALAVVAGLLGAVLGSAHPIASALVSAIAGALTAGVTMAICIVTMPDHVFGVRKRE